MSQTHGSQIGKRTDMWMVDVDDVIVIGVDTEDGPEHELWRADVRDAVDPALAPSIRKHGVLQPIRARRSKAHPGKVEVVVGRSRVRAVREILATDGSAPKVPCVVWPAGSTPSEVIGAANAENHIRKTESVLTTMEHAWAQVRAEGGAETKGALQSVATDLGIAVGKVRSLIKLRACPDVVAALRDGRIAETTAFALCSLPDAERERELLDAVTSPGAAPSVDETRKRVVRARNAAKSGKAESEVVTTLTMGELKRLAALGDATTLSPEVVAFLHVVVGAKAPASVPGLVEALRAVGVIRE